MTSTGEMVGITKMPQFLDAISFNKLGYMAIGSSNMLGPYWNGALAVFKDHKLAPNIPHIDYGTVSDTGFVDVVWLTESKLLVGTDTGSVEVWELKEGPIMENQITFIEHDDVCSAVTFSEHSNQIASSSWDGSIKIWDLAVDLSIHSIRFHTDKVLDVLFNPISSDVFATASEDGTIKIYDNRQSDKPAFLLFHQEIDYPCAIDWKSETELVAGFSNGDICHLDTRKRREAVARQHTHKKSVNCVQFHPNCKDLLASCSNDLSVKVYNIKNDTEIYSGTNMHIDYVKKVAFHPVDHNLWSCGWDGQILEHNIDLIDAV